jgi:hypothetical protein
MCTLLVLQMRAAYAKILKKMLPGKDLFAIFAKDLFLKKGRSDEEIWPPRARLVFRADSGLAACSAKPEA